MAGAEGGAVWRVMFWAESLPQGTLILTASPLPLFLILKAPSSVRLQGTPCEGRDGPGPYGREGQWESGLRGNRDVFCLLLFECMSSLKLVSGGQRPSMLIPQD